MKTITSKILAVTSLVFLFAASGTGSLTAKNTRSSGKALSTTISSNQCPVTYQQVANYLAGFGYHVFAVRYAGDGTSNMIAYSQFPVQTIVFIVGNQIIGHEDLPY